MSDFKVGDKVELIGKDNLDPKDLSIGDIGEVIEIWHDNKYGIMVRWESRTLNHYSENLKLVKENTMKDLKFEVGDEVSTPYGNGKIITVDDIYNTNLPYLVEYHDSRS